MILTYARFLSEGVDTCLGALSVGRTCQLINCFLVNRWEPGRGSGDSEMPACGGPKFGESQIIIILIFPREFIQLKKIIDFRDRGREREKHQFVLLLIYAFICSFLYVPWPVIKPTTLEYQDYALTNCVATLQGKAGAWYSCRQNNTHGAIGMSGMPLFMGGRAMHAAS